MIYSIKKDNYIKKLEFEKGNRVCNKKKRKK